MQGANRPWIILRLAGHFQMMCAHHPGNTGDVRFRVIVDVRR